MRIGFGYDVHALALGRSLALGGIIIPYKYGLEGHSDADVMIHALMDSLLGAAALRDIGYHFDDADKRYKDIDSKILLKHVLSLIEKAGYRFVNCDITLVAQRPKIAPYIPQMRAAIAEALNTDISQISIKATTEEHMVFTGRSEGMKCYAVSLIE